MMNQEVILYAPTAGMALGLLFLWGSLRLRRKRRLIDDLPTAKTEGVFIGLVELKRIMRLRLNIDTDNLKSGLPQAHARAATAAK